VNIIDGRTGKLIRSFLAYDSRFRGGVRVALADVNGDSVPDIITAPGPSGGPDIRVFDGRTGALIREFMAYEPSFTGGVFVAAGDVNADGFADIITGRGESGAPEVKVFSGATGSVLYDFMAYNPGFFGGVRVAAGDVNGDGRADIITGAGPHGGPHVQIFSGATGQLIRGFMAYSVNFAGGVFVAAGDVNGDGYADVITAEGTGGTPQVEVRSGKDGSRLGGFIAYDPSFSGGIDVSAADVNGDGFADIITAPLPGMSPQVKVFSGANFAELSQFFAYKQSFDGGLFVGASSSG
jgi:hypothetical protein